MAGRQRVLSRISTGGIIEAVGDRRLEVIRDGVAKRPPTRSLDRAGVRPLALEACHPPSQKRSTRAEEIIAHRTVTGSRGFLTEGVRRGTSLAFLDELSGARDTGEYRREHWEGSFDEYLDLVGGTRR